MSCGGIPCASEGASALAGAIDHVLEMQHAGIAFAWIASTSGFASQVRKAYAFP